MNGKHIILGVTGGIAVYKAADLCSKLVSAGADVRVVMTRNALQLISSQIFLTLSKNRVLTDLFEEYQPRPEHVDWAEWADALVVAPARQTSSASSPPASPTTPSRPPPWRSAGPSCSPRP